VNDNQVVTTPTARFLLVTWAGGGNVNPLMALARRLLDRGHGVRALGPGELQGRFQADGIAFRAHRSPGEWTGGAQAGSPQGAEDRQAACLRGMAGDLDQHMKARAATRAGSAPSP